LNHKGEYGTQSILKNTKTILCVFVAFAVKMKSGILCENLRPLRTFPAGFVVNKIDSYFFALNFP
jgi:hypothetical protein